MNYFVAQECKWLRVINGESNQFVLANCIPCRSMFQDACTVNSWNHSEGVRLFKKEHFNEKNTLHDTKRKLGKHEDTNNHVLAIANESQTMSMQMHVLYNIATIALTNMEMALPDLHFETRIAMCDNLNVQIGDKGHSRKMMQRWKNLFFNAIIEKLKQKINEPSSNIHFKFVRFLALSLDKYSIANISQQIVCIRTAMDGKMSPLPIGMIEGDYDNNENKVKEHTHKTEF